MDTAACLSDLWNRLGFASSAELTTTSWITTNEVYQFIDDAVKKLAYGFGLFVQADSSINIVSGTATYNLPASHIFTLFVWVVSGDGAVQLLRVTPVRDLWALDGSWSATSAPPMRCSMDAGSVGTVTLYPKPNAGSTLWQLCEEFPAAINSGARTVALPTVLQDYLTYKALAAARGKESDYAQPEMAAHFEQRAKLYEAVIGKLWGDGQ